MLARVLSGTSYRRTPTTLHRIARPFLALVNSALLATSAVVPASTNPSFSASSTTAVCPLRSSLFTSSLNTPSPYSTINSQPVRQMSTEAKEVSAPKPPALLKRAVVLDATEKHEYTIIWIHGLGDAGSSFIDFFEDRTSNTRVVLPNAPQIPITANGGYVMPGWYDIESFGGNRKMTAKFDEEGILNTYASLSELLDYEIAKVGSPDRVLMGGFSQGGACSMFAGHKYPQKLGGLIVTSGYLLLGEDAKKHVVQKDVPMLVYHGINDQVVRVDAARESKQVLEALGVTYTKYVEEPRLQHSFSPAELRIVNEFIDERFKAAASSPLATAEKK